MWSQCSLLGDELHEETLFVKEDADISLDNLGSGGSRAADWNGIPTIFVLMMVPKAANAVDPLPAMVRKKTLCGYASLATGGSHRGSSRL